MKKSILLILAFMLMVFLIAPAQALADISQVARAKNGVSITLNNTRTVTKSGISKANQLAGGNGAIRFHQTGF